MEYIGFHEMAEGAKCNLYARVVKWKGLREDPITKKGMTVYELDRNCSFEIEEKISLSLSEASVRVSLGVHMEVGDKLMGDAITTYIDTRKKIRFIIKEGLSSTHGGHTSCTSIRTIGVIKYPFSNLKKILENKEHLQIR